MRATELLIEFIEYGEEEWYLELDDIKAAIKLLNSCLKETPEDHEIAILLALIEHDDNEFDGTKPSTVYKQCIKKMRKELKELDNDY